MVEGEDFYGRIHSKKLDNVVRIMFKDFSSLGLFVEGPTWHKKVRQLNKLVWDYKVDLLVGCKTRTDWPYVVKEEDRFCNLFGNGQPTRGVFAANINDGKIKRDQWGGTCITTIGRFSSFVTAVGTNASGLGRGLWVYVGGGGRTTRIILGYQPCSTKKRRTMRETVWDQHTRYFEARGEICDPRTMFKADLISLLCRWKAEGDEILLMGNFNENVYMGLLAVLLAADDLHMCELCHRSTGELLPPTHA